jgi:UDP-N-acetylmuramoyl-tripeptide--D-alanyl-D-alanine ligase
VELRTSEVARVTGGRLTGDDVTVAGATIDSRAVRPGQLFVPLVAERDGHDFVGAAVVAGAAAYLTSRGPVPPDGDAGAPAVPAVEVADTTAALEALGRHARTLLPDRVVGVTGSVGKTSVKDLLAAVLAVRWPTSANVRSFNNELGVPLTLLEAPNGTEALVVEMGARGVGHVKALCDLAAPTVGVVTRVAAVHTETFGTIDDVARAKGELIEALPPTGVAVLNAEDPRVAAMASRSAAPVVTFGAGGDVRAEGVVLDHDLAPSFRLVASGPVAVPAPGSAAAGAVVSADVRLAVRGRHMVENALAAAAAGLGLGMTVDEVAAGLGGAVLSPWRMELSHLPGGARLLNDAYNANPTSMAAALDALAALPAGRRVAVLGVMAELGATSAADHAGVGDHARRLGIEVVGVGTDAYGGRVVAADPVAVAAALGPLGADDAVLLKGSRVAGLEHVAAALGA